MKWLFPSIIGGAILWVWLITPGLMTVLNQAGYY